MNMRSFFAENARACLRKVKEELGPGAIVVSNKSVSGGVEIMAMSEAALAAFSRPSPDRGPSTINRPDVRHTPAADQDYTVTLSSQAKKQPAQPSWVVAAHASRMKLDEPERPPLRPLPERGAATPVAPAGVS